MIHYHINRENNLEVELAVPPFIAEKTIKGLITEREKWEGLFPSVKKNEHFLMWENPENLENLDDGMELPKVLLRYGRYFFYSDDPQILYKLMKKELITLKNIPIVIKLRLNHI